MSTKVSDDSKEKVERGQESSDQQMTTGRVGSAHLRRTVDVDEIRSMLRDSGVVQDQLTRLSPEELAALASRMNPKELIDRARGYYPEEPSLTVRREYRYGWSGPIIAIVVISAAAFLLWRWLQ